jgi:hypothetical protein
MLASIRPRFARKSYLNYVDKERIERRDLLKRSLHDDDDDDDYLTHLQPTGSRVSRRGGSSSSGRKDSRKESKSSVNSARSHTDALCRTIDGKLSSPYIENRRKHRTESKDPIAQPVTTIFKANSLSRSNHSADASDETLSSSNHSADASDEILPSPYIKKRREHRTKSKDPIAQSVTTIPKTNSLSSSNHSTDASDKILPSPYIRKRRKHRTTSKARSVPKTNPLSSSNYSANASDEVLPSRYIKNRRKHRAKSKDPKAQPKTSTSRKYSSGRDDDTRSINSIAETAATMPETTPQLLSRKRIITARRTLSTRSHSLSRSNKKSIDPIAQLVTTIPKTTTSREHSSGRDDGTRSIDSIAESATTISETTPQLLPRKRIITLRRTLSKRSHSRSRSNTKSIDPIAQSVTTIPKTTTSRKHSSGRDDGTKSVVSIAESATTIPETTPQLLPRKRIITPRRTLSTRSRINHSLSCNKHYEYTSHSRQLGDIDTVMTSLSAHLSQKPYTSDNDDDDDDAESILSSIFRTLGEVYDDCL